MRSPWHSDCSTIYNRNKECAVPSLTFNLFKNGSQLRSGFGGRGYQGCATNCEWDEHNFITVTEPDLGVEWNQWRLFLLLLDSSFLLACVFPLSFFCVLLGIVLVSTVSFVSSSLFIFLLLLLLRRRLLLLFLFFSYFFFFFVFLLLFCCFLFYFFFLSCRPEWAWRHRALVSLFTSSLSLVPCLKSSIYPGWFPTHKNVLSDVLTQGKAISARRRQGVDDKRRFIRQTGTSLFTSPCRALNRREGLRRCSTRSYVCMAAVFQGPVSWRSTIVKYRQSSQSNRHSTIATRQSEYHEALPSSANDEVRCDCTFADDGNASWYWVCRVPMVKWRFDCENCRLLTVVGLHDTGPSSDHLDDSVVMESV